MNITKDGVWSSLSDLCSTCSKDNNGCVFKKVLGNYYDGVESPIRLMLMDCPEYRRTENRNDEISWGSFDDRVCTTINPSVTVRVSTGVTNSGT